MTIPIDELSSRIKAGLLRDPEGLLQYSRDCWPQAMAWSLKDQKAHAPAAALVASEEEDVARALAWSRKRGVFVVPRGAGSGVVGSAIPVREDSLVLDITRLNRKLDILPDGDTPRAVVGAGWLGGELEAALNEQGWSLMHFPASMDISTIGGWIAMDSYGQLSTRYGRFGDQVTAMRTVLPDGTLSAGEDCALHLGVEGILGVVTEATVRIRPLPKRRRFASLGFSGLEQALVFCSEALRADPPPSVLRLYSPIDAFLTGLFKRRKSRSSGSPSMLERLEPLLLKGAGLLNSLTALAGRTWVAVLVYEDEKDGFGEPPKISGGVKDLGSDPAERWWERRYHWSRARLERVFNSGCFADTVDLWAPWERLAAVESEVLKSVRREAFAFGHFSHFDKDGACLYVTFGGSGGGEVHARAWDAALAASHRAGGRVNHHHGFGLAKKNWLKEKCYSAWTREVLRRKADLDPQGLLNPGKFLEG